MQTPSFPTYVPVVADDQHVPKRDQAIDITPYGGDNVTPERLLHDGWTFERLDEQGDLVFTKGDQKIWLIIETMGERLIGWVV